MQAVLIAVVAVGGSQVFKLGAGAVGPGEGVDLHRQVNGQGQLQAAQGLAGGVVRRGLGLGAVIDAGGVQALNGQAPLQQLAQVPGQR